MFEVPSDPTVKTVRLTEKTVREALTKRESEGVLISGAEMIRDEIKTTTLNAKTASASSENENGDENEAASSG